MNIKNIKKSTWVSVIMILILGINMILTSMGKSPISLTEGQVESFVSIVVQLSMIGYVGWKNNSITPDAQITDDVLRMLRDGKITKDELNEFITKYKVKESQ